MKQYMVEMTLPRPLSYEFLALIPQQREAVEKLFEQGKIISYTLASDRSKLWATIQADDEEDLLFVLSFLPLTKFLKFTSHELAFNEHIFMGLPRVSLN